MHRSNRRVLQVEAMESRTLLSAVAPVLTMHSAHAVAVDVRGVTSLKCAKASQLDEAVILNKTKLTIEVRVKLGQGGSWSKFEKMDNNEKLSIDSRGKFVFVNVESYTPRRSAPNLPLNRPGNFYDGKVFTISTAEPHTFSVNV